MTGFEANKSGLGRRSTMEKHREIHRRSVEFLGMLEMMGGDDAEKWDDMDGNGWKWMEMDEMG